MKTQKKMLVEKFVEGAYSSTLRTMRVEVMTKGFNDTANSVYSVE